MQQMAYCEVTNWLTDSSNSA